MRKSVTQEYDYGCGVACFAFVCNVTYQEALKLLGRESTVKFGWKPSDLCKELILQGYKYKNRYVRKLVIEDSDYPDKTIVLIEKSTVYPVGHYLVKYKNTWMDPWLNLPDSNDINKATSGFRLQLPGKAMYTLIPINT